MPADLSGKNADAEKLPFLRKRVRCGESIVPSVPTVPAGTAAAVLAHSNATALTGKQRISLRALGPSGHELGGDGRDAGGAILSQVERRPGERRALLESHSGFTRREMLVVSAVLFAAGAFLLRSAVPDRARSHAATCRAQMRRLAVALQMYCSDYDGFFPLEGSWDTELVGLLHVRPPYSCPDVESTGQEGGWSALMPGHSMPGYAINGYLVDPVARAGWPAPEKPVNMAQIPHPAAEL